MKIFPKITNFVKKIAHNSHAKPYVLVEKTPKTQLGKYIPTHWVIPEGTDSFTIVKIGKKGNAQYEKKITTFYNGDKVLGRCTDINDVPIESKEFNYFDVIDKPQTGKAEKREIYTYHYEKGPYKPTLKGFEVQDIIRDEKNKINNEVRIEKNIFNEDGIIGTLKKCLTKAKREPEGNKLLQVKMKLVEGIPQIEETKCVNTVLPKNDAYLPCRFIFEPEEQIKALTNYHLKEKGLENLGVRTVFTDKIEDGTKAMFTVENRTIYYNKDLINNPVSTTAHEVEHAYQHSQIGRIGKGKTSYEKDCYKKFGEIKDKKELEEANKYYIASENYPKDPKSKEYFNNYLEVEARDAGFFADADYDDGRIFIDKQIGSKFDKKLS